MSSSGKGGKKKQDVELMAIKELKKQRDNLVKMGLLSTNPFALKSMIITGTAQIDSKLNQIEEIKRKQAAMKKWIIFKGSSFSRDACDFYSY